MRSLSILLPLMILTGCAWIASHPKEDALAVEVIEEAIEKLYEYETHTLSPAPPPGYPPMKIPGPSGP